MRSSTWRTWSWGSLRIRHGGGSEKEELEKAKIQNILTENDQLTGRPELHGKVWLLQVVWDTEESYLRLLLKWRIIEVCWGLHSKNWKGRPEISSNEGSCRRETAGKRGDNPGPKQGQSGGLGLPGESEEGEMCIHWLEKTIEQKTKENDGLTRISDDLTFKMESTDMKVPDYCLSLLC